MTKTLAADGVRRANVCVAGLRPRWLCVLLVVTLVGCSGSTDSGRSNDDSPASQSADGGEAAQARAQRHDGHAESSGIRGDTDGALPDASARELPKTLPLATDPTIDARTEGTRKMAEWLALIVRDADAKKTPSMARTVFIEEFRQRLKGKDDPLLRAHLGWHLLLDGQNDAALEEFREVERSLGTLNLPPDHEFFRNFLELLAIGHLRFAEQQNCLLNHSHESCIMPIQGGGIHQHREGAEVARDSLLRLLEQDPTDISCVWLLNLTYMTLGQYPDEVPPQWLIPPEAFASEYDIKRFRDVASATGTDLVSLSGGVVADDLNGDGLIDIMASDWGVDKQIRLLINEGDGSFRDATQAAGLDGEWGGLNLIHADYDNDGHLDVLVLRGAWLQDDGQYPNSLLRNRGDGRFDDVTREAGLLSFCPTQTGAWGDFNRDGLIDLFVGNETYRSKSYPCALYQNNGDGTFTDVAGKVGLSLTGRVKGAVWGDVNNDGLPDLYVSNFGGPNGLFINRGPTSGGWRFEDVTAKAGVGMPHGSFPTWFWDYDNDGWQDILVAPFSGFKFDGTALRTVAAEYLGQPTDADRIHLYRNRGDGTFENVAPALGLDKPLLAMGANFGDLDNDGFLDCYFGTGDPHFRTLIPNRMFRNDGAKRFQDVTTSGGFGHVQKGHGIAFADIDNDGDQDIYAVMGGALAGDVYQNVLFHNPGHGNHWLSLDLRGSPSNRAAIGARIEVQVREADGSVRSIYRTVSSGGSFGASSLRQTIGLGQAKSIVAVKVQWPSESPLQTFSELGIDRHYRIVEGKPAELVPRRVIDLARPNLKHTHGAHHH